jgi:hypothetical protein
LKGKHMMITSVSAAAAFFGFWAAALWWRASTIEIPDSIDTIVAELRRAGRWSAQAATCASIAAALTALVAVLTALR